MNKDDTKKNTIYSRLHRKTILLDLVRFVVLSSSPGREVSNEAFSSSSSFNKNRVMLTLTFV